MPYQATETGGAVERRVMKCSLQERIVWTIHCEVWLSKICSAGLFSVGCLKCFSPWINRSVFINPDSEISVGDAVVALQRSSGFILYGKFQAVGI
jgi:hypothetical protein